MTRKLLFTPGPLNTSDAVKRAMLRDAGSRDREFLELVRNIRTELLELAGVSRAKGFEAILLQGSGTYAVESVISSVVPESGKVLFLVNGAYGQRMAQIAARHKINHEVLRWPESGPVKAEAVLEKVRDDAAITHVAMVHCETSSGVLNPITQLGNELQKVGRVFIVDAMSSFGALPVHLANDGIDFLVSSANKCIQGVPGFAFVLARTRPLKECETRARTLSLDLYHQWRGLETNGQFRFTPPTHALLAFAEALRELRDEGGVAGRGRRYAANHKLLLDGMKRFGFVPFLKPEHQSIIITAFHYPGHPKFDFNDFYERLSKEGMIIYPGKLTKTLCFRMGNIGHLFEEDIQALLAAIERVLKEMGVPVPVPAPDVNT